MAIWGPSHCQSAVVSVCVKHVICHPTKVSVCGKNYDEEGGHDESTAQYMGVCVCRIIGVDALMDVSAVGGGWRDTTHKCNEAKSCQQWVNAFCRFI